MASSLDKLFSNIDKSVKKRNATLSRLEDFENDYGVKYYISTGLPSFDLMLMGNEDGQTRYGFPTNRIVEISGDSASYKTQLSHMLSARVRKMGGPVFLIQSEFDFQLSYYRSFYDRLGLDFEKEVDPFVRVGKAKTIGEAVNIMRSIMPNIAEYYENGGADVPAIIVLDSLAAMMGTENAVRYEKDDVDRQGSHASEIHKMFKSVMEDLGKYNIMLLVINQFRANMSPRSMKANVPAHDRTIKYYASVRLELSSRNKDKATYLTDEYQKTKICKVKVSKIRGNFTANGVTELIVWPNHGFIYLESLIEAMNISGLTKNSRGRLILQPDESEKDLEEFFIARSEDLQFTRDMLTKAIKEGGSDIMLRLEDACHKRGPKNYHENAIKDDDIMV